MLEEQKYHYVLWHPDYGFFCCSHYPELNDATTGLLLPLQLGKWNASYRAYSTMQFESEAEAKKYTNWLMPAAKEAIQLIKVNCCLYSPSYDY